MISRILVEGTQWWALSDMWAVKLSVSCSVSVIAVSLLTVTEKFSSLFESAIILLFCIVFDVTILTYTLFSGLIKCLKQPKKKWSYLRENDDSARFVRLEQIIEIENEVGHLSSELFRQTREMCCLVDTSRLLRTLTIARHNSITYRTI